MTTDKETERMKVEMFGNYAFSFHATKLVLFVSILIALIVALFAAFIAKQLSLTLFMLGIIGSEALIVLAMRDRLKMFKRELKYLDGLIEKLDNNQPLGTMEDILRGAPK